MAIKGKPKTTASWEQVGKTATEKTTNTKAKQKKATTKNGKTATSKKNTKTTASGHTKQKYDWISLKQEFFESDFLEVAPFMVQKFDRNIAENWNNARKIKWWADEKREIKENMRKEAMENFKNNLSKKWEETLDKLEEAHIKWLDDLVEMIMEQGKSVEKMHTIISKDEEWNEIELKQKHTHVLRSWLWHKDIIEILKHIKLEKWEPLDIVDNNGKSNARAWLEDLKQQKSEKKSK